MTCRPVALRLLAVFCVIAAVRHAAAAEPTPEKGKGETKPTRPWVVYLLPHSHVDIGFTHVQTDVEKLQWKHLDEAVALRARPPTIRPGPASNGIAKSFGPWTAS